MPSRNDEIPESCDYFEFLLTSGFLPVPVSYFVHGDLRLVVTTGFDCVSWSEVKACQDRTRADPDFSSQFNQIVDVRAVRRFDMSAEQVRMLARRMIFSFDSKRAFVASSPYVFGMGRMWQAFVELSDHPSQVRVFNDLASALQWLGLNALPISLRSDLIEIRNSICNHESAEVIDEMATGSPIVMLKTECPKSAFILDINSKPCAEIRDSLRAQHDSAKVARELIHLKKAILSEREPVEICRHDRWGPLLLGGSFLAFAAVVIWVLSTLWP